MTEAELLEALRALKGASTEKITDLLASVGLDPSIDLKGADLRSAAMAGEQLAGADLSGTDFTDAVLSNANLEGANLVQAFLRRARLDGANLRGAKLVDASVVDASLEAADLTGADLSSCDLTGADLRGAVLRDANLTGADLSGAGLGGADLTGARLERVVGWPPPNTPAPVAPTAAAVENFVLPDRILQRLIPLLRDFAIHEAVRGLSGLPTDLHEKAERDALAEELRKKITEERANGHATGPLLRDLAVLSWERGVIPQAKSCLDEADADQSTATDPVLARELRLVKLGLALVAREHEKAVAIMRDGHFNMRNGPCEALLLVALASIRRSDAGDAKAIALLAPILGEQHDPVLIFAVRALRTSIDVRSGKTSSLLELLNYAKQARQRPTRRLLQSVEALLAEVG